VNEHELGDESKREYSLRYEARERRLDEGNMKLEHFKMWRRMSTVSLLLNKTPLSKRVTNHKEVLQPKP
jgi:hypothetical protein